MGMGAAPFSTLLSASLIKLLILNLIVSVGYLIERSLYAFIKSIDGFLDAISSDTSESVPYSFSRHFALHIVQKRFKAYMLIDIEFRQKCYRLISKVIYKIPVMIQ